MEPAWKSIVENLKSSGFQSRYLDRLYDRLGDAATAVAMKDGLRALEREIVDEMAFALRRAEDKVNFALLELEYAGARIEEIDDPAEIELLKTVYEEKRRRARRALWEYKVHREALGLLRHDVIDELFPMPPPPPCATRQ